MKNFDGIYKLVNLIRNTAGFVEAQLNFSDDYNKKIKIISIIQIILITCIVLSPIVGTMYLNYMLDFWIISIILLAIAFIYRLGLLVDEVEKYLKDE